MKLVYYDSTSNNEVDDMVVLVNDDQDMKALDEEAADMLDGAERQGEVELDPDDARKLERIGMCEGRWYIG